MVASATWRPADGEHADIAAGIDAVAAYSMHLYREWRNAVSAKILTNRLYPYRRAVDAACRALPDIRASGQTLPGTFRGLKQTLSWTFVESFFVD